MQDCQRNSNNVSASPSSGNSWIIVLVCTLIQLGCGLTYGIMGVFVLEFIAYFSDVSEALVTSALAYQQAITMVEGKKMKCYNTQISIQLMLLKAIAAFKKQILYFSLFSVKVAMTSLY